MFHIHLFACVGGVSVITEKGDITTSYLLIQRARPSDSGKYICLPSNANSETINVHVLNGKYHKKNFLSLVMSTNCFCSRMYVGCLLAQSNKFEMSC